MHTGYRINKRQCQKTRRQLKRPSKRVYLTRPSKWMYLTRPSKRMYLTHPSKRMYLTRPSKRMYLTRPSKRVYLTRPSKRVYLTPLSKRVYLTRPRLVVVVRMLNYVLYICRYRSQKYIWKKITKPTKYLTDKRLTLGNA